MARLRTLMSIAAAATLVAACGDAGDGASPPGSPENPLVAQSQPERANEGAVAAEEKQGFQAILENQRQKPPESRFTPCLVSRAQARAFLGAPVVAPVEAPQGPTCIYRSEDGDAFVTVAVQSLDIDQLKRELQLPRAMAIADRRAYCGRHGQPMLYVSLSGNRVLSVGAPCSVARRFATTAVARLSG
jgi:hypothetical protein